jgi:hypothetical protein
MDIHPWTRYELAQARDRLLDRLLRREVGVSARAPARPVV